MKNQKEKNLNRMSLYLRTTAFCLLGFIFISATPECAVFSKKYKLDVTLAGKVEGNTVYLKDANRKTIDSTIIKDNKFNFRGKIDYPNLYTLVIVNGKQPNPNFQPVIPIFLENSKISISAHVDSLSNMANFRGNQYKYEQVTVKGSESHRVYLDYVAGYEPIYQNRKAAFRKYLDYLNYPGNATVYDGIKLVDKVDEYADQRDQYIKEYIKKNPESFVSLYNATDNIHLYSVKEIDEIVSYLSPRLLKTKPGKTFTETAKRTRNAAAGAMYTDLSFKDDKGNSVKLSDYVGKGKYVLLEFWASWCVPCRADIPHIKQNYELYHPEGFEMISISMDAKKDDWLKAVEEEKMKWLQISDLNAFNGEVSKIYNFSGVPTCILINPEGKIVTRNMRGSWMDKKLIELYGDKFGDKKN